jgi:hypothetical protein
LGTFSFAVVKEMKEGKLERSRQGACVDSPAGG